MFRNKDEYKTHNYNLGLYRGLAQKLNLSTRDEYFIEVDDFLNTLEYRHFFYISEPGNSEYFELSPETKSRIEAFLGPHGDALLKAYKIQRGLE